ncbi:MAG TPA: ASPIC/UnbV domain-containing protein [Verrucomicrobiota bacterium]|nr:ASPIC/UnbV domain-containing protein [Verrucomicrobiota bacterium]
MRLLGTRSNRDAIGARVRLHANGATQVRDLFATAGYFAGQSDSRLHFGLDTASQVDWIEIRWPSGQEQTLPGTAVGAVDRILEINEPATLLLAAPRLTMTGFEFAIQGTMGGTYRILCSDDITATPWTQAAIVTIESSSWIWSDAGPRTATARFYRIESVSQ